MGNKVAIYCRISRDKVGAGLGVQRQQQDAEALAERLGLEVVGTYVDNDISAYSGKRRPAYREMLERLDGGGVDAVICWHTDRLHRSPKELEEYIDVSERNGVVTHSVQSGELDLATASGRAVARTLGAWSRFESEQKADRIRRAKRQAIESDRWIGGQRPWGWNIAANVASANGPEAEWVAKATYEVLRGRSLRSILADIEAAGLPTSQGGKWTTSTLRKILLRPHNAGLREVGGEFVEQSLFPPLVAEDAWRGVRAILLSPDRRSSADNVTKYLLTSLAYCECGKTVTIKQATSKGRKYPAYACKQPGGGHVSKKVDKVHEVMDLMMPRILAVPSTWAAVTKPRESGGADLAAEAAGLRARLDELSDAFAEGAITMAQMQRASSKMNEKLEALEGQMTLTQADSVVDADGRTPEQLWHEGTLGQRRALIAATAKVTLLRSSVRGAFDYSSVKVEPA